MSDTPAAPKTALEHATDAVGLALTLVALYRFAYPEGPEPLELVRDGLERARLWLEGRQRNRERFDADREAIRNLPETEGLSE